MKSGDNATHSVAYYLERAASCERLAAEATTEENRQILLMVAARWRRFAAEENSESPPEKG